MISTLGLWAHWLDAWPRTHFGRAYAAALGTGLVIGIIATVEELGKAISSGVDVLKLAGLVLFQGVLLVNQLAQFHDFRQEVRQRREERRKGPPPTAP